MARPRKQSFPALELIKGKIIVSGQCSKCENLFSRYSKVGAVAPHECEECESGSKKKKESHNA